MTGLPEPPRATAGEVHLTPTERRLVETLSREPGRVFSRQELVQHAMPQTIVLPRTVDVHIRSLRKKLGARRIKTVRGRGYCWGA